MSLKMIKLIQNNDQAKLLCNDLKRKKVIAFDMEFDNRHSYKTKVALIQIGIDHKEYLIDTLAVDFTIFKTIFEDPDIEILLFSGSSDIQLLKSLFKIETRNIYDVQIGYLYGENNKQPNLASVVKSLCDVKIIKSKRLQKANWLKRPINFELYEYAASDVRYLAKCMEILQNREKYEHRDVKLMSNQLRFCNNMNEHHIFNLFDFIRKNKIKTVLEKLFTYRCFVERNIIAKKRNITPGYVLKNNDLLKIVKSEPYLMANSENHELLKKIQPKIRKKILSIILGMKKQINADNVDYSKLKMFEKKYNKMKNYKSYVDKNGDWNQKINFEVFSDRYHSLNSVLKTVEEKLEMNDMNKLFTKHFRSYLILNNHDISIIINNIESLKSRDEFIAYIINFEKNA